jgi:transposase, IS5 family
MTQASQTHRQPALHLSQAALDPGPCYPKTGSKGGRLPYPLETMLRIHLLQQWYDLSDPAMEDALIEVPTMRRFAGINLISDRIPDETTILSFRHQLEKHDLGKQIFETVKAHLKANGMAMKQGTIIDATLITAPSSTKNNKGGRDPDMHQTKKGNHRRGQGQWPHPLDRDDFCQRA